MNNNKELDINSLLDVSSVPGANPESLDTIEISPPIVLKDVVSNPQDPAIDLNEDYKLVRKSLIQRSDLGMDLLKDMITSAKETENPKYVLAAVELLKEIGSIDRDLIKFHESIKKIAPPTNNQSLDQNEATKTITKSASPNSLLEDDMMDKENIEDAEYTEIED